MQELVRAGRGRIVRVQGLVTSMVEVVGQAVTLKFIVKHFTEGVKDVVLPPKPGLWTKML